ncbi:PBSX family phage terminase large subunit [Bradyrhizobium sp. th.b2]|uniref:PBSX family phage terminase large subunit n=1 Tax=Bradyrhizobium sp. th-b2 TaxID=172088 RepID=UPI00041D7FA3|nr:phage terminase large subunit [Bradyrhizobium sp. th.b2]
MTAAQILLPPKLVDVFTGEAMYRGAFGGRGSAKTRSFAKMAAVRAMMWATEGREGIILCGREFMNSLADSSLAEVKFAISSEPWLADFFDVGETYVRTKCRRISFVFAGLRHNLESIKSKAKILLLWVDEAEPVSNDAWDVTIPTVREEGAEIWITWNPDRKKSATHKRFRESPPEGSKIIELNWRDNPFFPAILNKTRLDDQKNRPDQYDWVWNGGFRTVVEGAYYAKGLLEAKEQGRIAFVPRDPLMQVRAYWDIGGTGAKADATAIWIAQFIGQQINVLDYYEAQGQPLSAHVAWLRDRKWDKALCVLPHDGAAGEKVFATSYESAIREAGFDVLVVPNQGAGAASARIETGRRLFPRIFFNGATTEPGRDALGWYHEKRSNDKERDIGLGPNHDWSSHGADAFGLMCIHYDQPAGAPPPRDRYRDRRSSGGGSWQSV